jgi:hypothetical protein
MAGQSTLRNNRGRGHARKQAWLPAIPFFTKENRGIKGDDKDQMAESRSYKIKIRPGMDEEDTYHYTLAIRELEYTSPEKDPET